MAFNKDTVDTKSYTCAFFAESGRCKRGDQCKYTHGPARLGVADKPGWDAKAGRFVAGNNARHLKVAFQQPQNALPSGNIKSPAAPAAADPPRRLSADAAEFVPGAAAPAAAPAPVVPGCRGEPQGVFPLPPPPPKTPRELVEDSGPLPPVLRDELARCPYRTLRFPPPDPKWDRLFFRVVEEPWRPRPEDDPFASWNG